MRDLLLLAPLAVLWIVACYKTAMRVVDQTIRKHLLELDARK